MATSTWRVSQAGGVDILRWRCSTDATGLKEMAGTALLRAVSSGSQPWRLQQLSPAAGIRLCHGRRRRRPDFHLAAAAAAMDKILKRSAQQSASYVDNAELLALAALPFGSVAARAELVTALRETAVEAGTMTAVGPLAAGIENAPWSLSEARCALDFAGHGHFGRWRGRCQKPKEWCSTPNTSPWSAWSRTIWTRVRQDFVRQQLGPVLEHDARRNSQLLATLRPGSTPAAIQRRPPGTAPGTAVDAPPTATDFRTVRRRSAGNGPARCAAPGHPAGRAVARAGRSLTFRNNNRDALSLFASKPVTAPVLTLRQEGISHVTAARFHDARCSASLLRNDRVCAPSPGERASRLNHIK